MPICKRELTSPHSRFKIEKPSSLTGFPAYAEKGFLMIAFTINKTKFVCSIALMLLAAEWSLGQTLSQKIDAEVAKPIADFEKKAAPLCSDLEFIRRVTLT